MKFIGLLGIVFILLISFLLSNNKKRINLKTVFVGLFLQVLLGLFVLKTSLGMKIFGTIGRFIEKILEFSNAGGDFVFGILTNSPLKVEALFGEGTSFIFALKLIPTIIFILVLVNILYYYGIMQRIIQFFAKIMYKIMDVSGAEALSNIGSAFVGQVEAQIIIKPYLVSMTNSELLASMTGSMACIAGGVMAIYISLGVPAEYLLAASIMAAPGALVISKIVFPETEESLTKNEVKIEIERKHVNVIDAIAHGASDGMSVSINVIAMLIALIALIALVDWLLGYLGIFLSTVLHLNLSMINIDLNNLNLQSILGALFAPLTVLMGVPLNDASSIGALFGEKLVFNEFIAYTNLIEIKSIISHKALVIATFALCGFANLGSIAIQIGGIGQLAPERRKDLARLGFKALVCGTLASYLSACIAGILLS